MLRSDSIFPYQRLLVRDDVESFLSKAFRQDGVIRAVLHGLLGAGYYELLIICQVLHLLNKILENQRWRDTSYTRIEDRWQFFGYQPTLSKR
jgi:hypothetical protein